MGSILIDVVNRQNDVNIDVDSVCLAVETVFEDKAIHAHEVAFYFVSEEDICHYHDHFFNDPSPTDCITLPMDDPNEGLIYCHIGEAFICPQAAINYAKETKGDVYEEITRYVVHCILHLLGYEDTSQTTKKIMKAEEDRLLDHLKVKNALITPIEKIS